MKEYWEVLQKLHTNWGQRLLIRKIPTQPF